METNLNKTFQKKITLGAAQFGLDYGVSNTMGKTPKKEVIKILNFAKSVGIRTIDTAQAYGNSEITLGNAGIKGWDVITKFGNVSRNGSIFPLLNKSKDDLQDGNLYAFISHNAQTLLDNDYVWDELLELKERKFVKKIGFSIYTPDELQTLLHLGYIPDIIQIPYNILDRRFEFYFKEISSFNIEIHVRSVFLQGLFFMDPQRLHPFFNPVKDFLAEFNDKFQSPSQKIKELLSFPLLNSDVNKVVIGTNNCQQLKMNIASLSFKTEPILELPVPKIDENILLPYNWPK